MGGEYVSEGVKAECDECGEGLPFLAWVGAIPESAPRPLVFCSHDCAAAYGEETQLKEKRG